MHCYKHNNKTAVGICKSCNKAVCEECANDTGLGLACSEECVQEVNDYNLTMKKAKKLYSLGVDGPKIPTGILLLWAIGIIMFGTGVYRYFEYQIIDFISLSMGAIFIVLGYIGYKRNKDIGTGC